MSGRPARSVNCNSENLACNVHVLWVLHSAARKKRRVHFFVCGSACNVTVCVHWRGGGRHYMDAWNTALWRAMRGPSSSYCALVWQNEGNSGMEERKEPPNHTA